MKTKEEIKKQLEEAKQNKINMDRYTLLLFAKLNKNNQFKKDFQNVLDVLVHYDIISDDGNNRDYNNIFKQFENIFRN
jgi:hypothetical protein